MKREIERIAVVVEGGEEGRGCMLWSGGGEKLSKKDPGRYTGSTGLGRANTYNGASPPLPPCCQVRGGGAVGFQAPPRPHVAHISSL